MSKAKEEEKLIIREAIPSKDEDQIAELWRQCGLVTSYNDPVSDLRFACMSPTSTVFVAQKEEGEKGERAGPIVGTVMVGHDGHRGWLYYVACSPDCRKLGIGRQVIDAAESWLKKNEIRKSMLLVRKGNEKVIDFYTHIGYQETPRVTMAKWLDESQTIPP